MMFLSPEAICQVIHHQSSSSDAANSSISGSNKPSPPATINLSENTEVEQQQYSFSFVPIHDFNASEGGLHATSPHSGCETPSSVTDAKPDSKSKVIKDREKGAVAYTVEEYVAVLQLMLLDRNAFNARESSMEWRNVHRAMCENFYL
jgi:hypothetical protein